MNPETDSVNYKWSRGCIFLKSDLKYHQENDLKEVESTIMVIKSWESNQDGMRGEETNQWIKSCLDKRNKF